MEPFTTVACDDGGFDTLSDDEVVERVKDLAAAERRASVALIRSLVEFDARRLYLREGCSSLFTYCTQVLHLSEVSTYNRIETARAARHYPRVLEALECGDVTLTAVRLLAPHLTAANHEEMLVAARHKSKQQIQELIASLSPRPAAPTVIRRIPSRTGAAPPIATPPRQDTSETASAGTLVRCATGRDAGPAIVPHALAAAAVTPLAAEHYKLQVTLSRETHEKLRRAQALARHALAPRWRYWHTPRSCTDPAHRPSRAAQICPGVCAATKRRRRHGSGTPHTGGPVKRAVWQRDQGCCAFVGRMGRCRETGFLEFHHVSPYAAGGSATADDIQLRCRAHNQYEARLFFGDMLVARAAAAMDKRPHWP